MLDAAPTTALRWVGRATKITVAIFAPSALEARHLIWRLQDESNMGTPEAATRAYHIVRFEPYAVRSWDMDALQRHRGDLFASSADAAEPATVGAKRPLDGR